MVKTLYDFLGKDCRVPERPVSAPMCIYKIEVVGDVLAGRVEQSLVKPGDEVIFLPTHTASNPCVAKVFTVEMYHQRAEQAKPGDNQTGDNLLKQEDSAGKLNIGSWKGNEVEACGSQGMVKTFYDFLEKVCRKGR